MADTIFAGLLLLIVFGLVVARKTYTYLPVKELKRRAEKHDPLAATLYRAVAYGNSLKLLLLILIVVCSAAGFVLLARVQPAWLSLLIVIAVLWLGFSWLPDTRVSGIGAKFTVLVTPFLSWLLRYSYRIVSLGADLEDKYRVRESHTGLFERSDLLALIEHQQKQEDNRLSPEELDILKHTLQFDDLKVADILKPRQQVKSILASDTVGPILINELHESGQDFVLVSESAKGVIVGTLAYRDIGLKSTGHVRDIMSHTVYFVHENDSLRSALHTFFATNYPMFVVINSAEEYLGIITVQDILKALLGHVPGEDFDQYSDIHAVAHRYQQKEEPESPTDYKVVKSGE